ncbi:hypothetical protein [Chryseobacterium indoltheticum]|uniref:hypothetical protein n=1 Tax=Chryseobacterium indoltheticum TaxID=254 RepID=UPI003F4932BB
MKHFYLYFFLLLSAFYSSQELDTISRSNLQGSVSMQFGKFLGTNDYLKELKHREFIGASAELTVQTDGSEEWHRRFGKPYYGGGIIAFDYLKNSEMGKTFCCLRNFWRSY